jgi:hypothetical protein
VVRELLLAEALRRGLAADAAEVERAYDLARVGFRDEERWSEELKKQGLTPRGFREELRAKQTVGLLLSQEADKVEEPGEADVRDAYARLPGGKDKPAFDGMKDQLREQLWRVRREQHVQGLVNRLRGNARIETFL